MAIPKPITSILLLFFASLSRAIDMSIVEYHNKHLKNPEPRTEQEVMTMYEEWLAKHGKAYNAIGEKERRFEIFKDNLKFVEEHNYLNRPYKVGLNRFADMTNEEYRSMFLGTKTDSKRRFAKAKGASQRYVVRRGEMLPEAVDWRGRGAVAPIKNQGSWRSCCAFSTVAAVEGINQNTTRKLIRLSEQELVEYAFEFIITNGGMDTESDYHYRGLNDTCAYIHTYVLCSEWLASSKKNANLVSIDGYEDVAAYNEEAFKMAGEFVLSLYGYEDVPAYNEEALKKAVSHQPVSVAIEAGGRALQLYSSGVFTGECGAALDHRVVIVGYGTEDGVDYWIVRNSWGTEWGEDGYLRLERNVRSLVTGKCGIAMQASYPIKINASFNAGIAAATA